MKARVALLGQIVYRWGIPTFEVTNCDLKQQNKVTHPAFEVPNWNLKMEQGYAVAKARKSLISPE